MKKETIFTPSEPDKIKSTQRWDQLRSWIRIQSERERSLIEQFPGTPFAIIRITEQRIAEYNAHEAEEARIDKNIALVTELAFDLRNFLIAEGVISSDIDDETACGPYSERLCDIYNYVFEKLSLADRAYVVSGHFNGAFTLHRWVVISEKQPSDDSSELLHDIQQMTIVDGTVQQYVNSYILPSAEDRALIDAPVLVIPEGMSGLRHYYIPTDVAIDSVAERSHYFFEKHS